jgi:sentrin-specific protease 7
LQLNLNWFPPAEAYQKRTFIRRLIFELAENHGSLEGFSPDNGDDNGIGGQCRLINGESSTSHSSQGIELAPPLNTSSMVLKEHFEPGATLGTSLRHCQFFDQQSSNHCSNGSISTMEVPTYHVFVSFCVILKYFLNFPSFRLHHNVIWF